MIQSIDEIIIEMRAHALTCTLLNNRALARLLDKWATSLEVHKAQSNDKRI